MALEVRYCFDTVGFFRGKRDPFIVNINCHDLCVLSQFKDNDRFCLLRIDSYIFYLYRLQKVQKDSDARHLAAKRDYGGSSDSRRIHEWTRAPIFALTFNLHFFFLSCQKSKSFACCLDAMSEQTTIDQPAAATAATSPEPNIGKLVIDTNVIVNGAPIRHLAKEFYTCPEVLAEVRSAHSREYLARLPFEIKVLNPSEDSVRAGKIKEMEKVGCIALMCLITK